MGDARLTIWYKMPQNTRRCQTPGIFLRLTSATTTTSALNSSGAVARPMYCDSQRRTAGCALAPISAAATASGAAIRGRGLRDAIGEARGGEGMRVVGRGCSFDFPLVTYNNRIDGGSLTRLTRLAEASGTSLVIAFVCGEVRGATALFLGCGRVGGIDVRCEDVRHCLRDLLGREGAVPVKWGAKC